MSAILLHALAVHAIAAGHLTAQRALRAILAGGVPDPAPQAPPGLAGKVNTILGWGKWGVLICGVAGLLLCGGKMAIGHRNRSVPGRRRRDRHPVGARRAQPGRRLGRRSWGCSCDPRQASAPPAWLAAAVVIIVAGAGLAMALHLRRRQQPRGQAGHPPPAPARRQQRAAASPRRPGRAAVERLSRRRAAVLARGRTARHQRRPGVGVSPTRRWAPCWPR